MRARRLTPYWPAFFPMLLALVALPPAAMAEHLRVPGTQVTMAPPAGFTFAEQFPGFQRTESGASIMVTEIAGPAVMMQAAMTEEGLASRGMTLIAAEATEISGREAVLVHAGQAAGDVQFEKWLAVFGDDKRTVLLVATFPQAVADSYGDAMRQALLSARWDPSLQVGLFDGLSFRVTETAGLKFTDRMSNAVLLTAGGKDERLSPEEPLAVVGASLGDAPIDDVEAFARWRVTQTAQVTGVANIQGRALTVDGLEAYELTAEASDARSGVAVRVYQLVALNGSGYFLIQGLVGAAHAAEYLPQFAELAASLKRVP